MRRVFLTESFDASLITSDARLGIASAMFGEYVFVNLPLSAEAIRLAPDAVPTLHRIICLRRCSLS